ncbi:MAG: TonB-dependent receptor domain-containing protein [Chitinophagaceae bacterium]
MRKIYKIILLCLATIVCINLYAQQSAKIIGTVKSTDNKPVEAATVSLLKVKDTSLVKIAVTDKSGNYEFEKIKSGNYFLSIEAVGYNKFFSHQIELTENTANTQVAAIQLTLTQQQLSGVSVSARRPLIENKIDKTVVNVDASPTNTGISALEVLEKSPGVTVDNDGNISLKGKQGVIVMIDGKPTYLNKQDLANYLKNMPSNQLDQIEIMSQPSAKYDASGNSGVINFVTKKNKANGFNGSITTSAIIAQYFKNTNSININWRKGKTNIYGNYGYSYWEGFNDIYIDRNLRDTTGLPFNRYVEQHTFGRFSDRSHDFKAGIDFLADKNTTFGFAVKGTIDNQSFTSTGTANIFDSLHNFVQYNNAISQTKTPLTNVGFNLNFQKKLNDKGKEISADADYIFYNTPGIQYSDNYLYNSDKTPSELPYLLNGNLPALIDIFSFKADYKQPLKGNATLEAGIKSSYVKTDNNAEYSLFNNDSQKWEHDDTLSNHFIYKENINAAYVNVNKQIKKFSVQLGLRAEQTIADGNQITKQISFNKNYIQLFPTAYFSYQKNDKNTFGLSYGRRIERPDYQQLNPFQFQLDRYTYEQGNPNLQPQFSHNIELSYNYKGELNVSANYSITNDIINDVLITRKTPGDSNYTTYQTSQNIASNTNVGLSVNYSKQLKKWWTINVFGNVFNNHYKGIIDGQNIDANITSFNGNFSSQFNFNKGWSTELSGWYNAKNLVSSAILAEPMGMFSFGGGKKILKDKGSIRINIRDPFYLAHFKGSTDLNQSFTQIKSYWDNRRAIITFNYRFGKTNGQQTHHNSAAEDEQNRVKVGNNQQ